jgi:hypothetical protein
MPQKPNDGRSVAMVAVVDRLEKARVSALARERDSGPASFRLRFVDVVRVGALPDDGGSREQNIKSNSAGDA